MSPNERAFDELVLTQYGRLCNFVYRYVQSRPVAEDIVQDVFVRILQRGTFDYTDPLPYLYRAARNGAVSHLRKQHIRDRYERQARPHESKETADAEASYQELAEAVAAGVESLPPRARLIFTMSREQGLSYAEIARALGISIKTVENQMGRALKLLRQRLGPFLGLAVASATQFIR